MTNRETAKKEALERLRENANLEPGDTVYTVLRHVSRSGMQRVIQLIHFEKGEPRWWGYNAAVALGLRYDEKREGIVVNGCGMDMGFHLVYELSNLLFPNGATGRTGKHEPGGYVLQHRWL